MGWESQEDGIMGKILHPDGSKDIAVGTVVAVSVEEESELSEVENYQPGSGGSSSSSSSSSSEASESAASSASAEKSGGNGSGQGDEQKTVASGSSAFPPHQVWTMPALSPTMTAGNIAKWFLQVGDEVSTGDGMVEVETDKATMMWESVEEGYVAKILAPDGTTDISVWLPLVLFSPVLHANIAVCNC